MTRGDAVAGGEESGGYAFAFHLPERDGVFNALLLIESLALAGYDLDTALAGLSREFGEFAYGRRDVYLPVPIIEDFLAEVKANPPGAARATRSPPSPTGTASSTSLGSRGWLLHRLSGTEPMIRLYCEHEDEAAMERILDEAHARLVAFAAGRGATPRRHV